MKVFNVKVEVALLVEAADEKTAIADAIRYVEHKGLVPLDDPGPSAIEAEEGAQPDFRSWRIP